MATESRLCIRRKGGRRGRWCGEGSEDGSCLRDGRGGGVWGLRSREGMDEAHTDSSRQEWDVRRLACSTAYPLIMTQVPRQ